MQYLDPTNKAFAAAIANETGPHVLGYVEGRKALVQIQQHDPAPDILTETTTVSGKYGPTSVVIVRRKELRSRPLPVVFYTHGGGWILGCPASFSVLLEDLARRTGAAIVFPYYTPAPDKQFPFQFEQTYEVLEYIANNGKDHDLISDSIALAGDSVGGHMAIAMMNMSLSRNLPSRIAHIILFYPVTATHIRRPSYETFREGPFLHADTMEWMIDAFLPDHRDRETALASPLTFLGDDVLARFAPTTLIMSTVDPLLDEGLEFGYRLQEAGVDASIVKAEGQMHAFVLLKGLRDNPTARAMMDLTACKLREALEISW